MQQAVIYARFSTSEQSKGHSLERQRTKGIAYADAQGWHVESVLSDEGRSAFHGANRREGAALHEFELEAENGLHAGKVLVVENIDRLTRQGAKAAARLIWGLNEQGVSVATWHDNKLFKAGSDSDLLDILTIVMTGGRANEESAVKSERTKASWGKREQRIEAGEKDVAVPHAPNWVKRIVGGYVLDDHRTAVLNEIYDLYIDGLGIHRIVTLLNERCEPSWTPSESKRNVNGWFYSYIYRLLNKREVMGEYVTGEGRVLSTDFYPQAITAEKFNRAQHALSLRKSNERAAGGKHRNLLAQLVYCAECGGGAHFRNAIDRGQTFTKKSGEVVVYKRNEHRRLRCDRARRKRECDNPAIIDYDVVERTILDEMLPRIAESRRNNKEAAELRRQIAEIGRQQLATQSRLNNLVEAIADGGSKTLVARAAELEQLIEQQEQEGEALKRKLAIETSQPSIEDLAAKVAAMRADLTAVDDDTRFLARTRTNAALRGLIHKIDLHANDTFSVWTNAETWWHFDNKGEMIQGWGLPYLPVNPH